MLVLFSSLCKQSISKAVTDSPGTFSFPSSESCWKPKSQAFLRCFGQNTSLSSTSRKSVRLAVATEPWQHPCAMILKEEAEESELLWPQPLWKKLE